MVDESGVIEPVRWDSHLIRTPGVRYTEVAGTPVLIDPIVGEVQPLTVALAGVWAQLDGREIADSLDVDPESLSAVDRRNLIEVLRRLKARGVIIDAASGRPGARDDELLESGDANSIRCRLRGRLDRVDGWTLAIDRSATTVHDVRLGDHEGVTRATFRRRLRRRRVDHITVPNEGGSDTSPVVGALAEIVAALEDSEVFSSPGAGDLLAGLAERATAPESPWN